MIAFKDILKLLGWVMTFISWERWKKRAEDADIKNRLDDQTHGAETDIRDNVDKVTRPPHGPDDDLLDSKLGHRVRTKLRPKMSRQERRGRRKRQAATG